MKKTTLKNILKLMATVFIVLLVGYFLNLVVTIYHVLLDIQRQKIKQTIARLLACEVGT